MIQTTTTTTHHSYIRPEELVVVVVAAAADEGRLGSASWAGIVCLVRRNSQYL